MSEYRPDYLFLVTHKYCERSSHYFIYSHSYESKNMKNGLVTHYVLSVLINVSGVSMCTQSLLITVLIVCSTKEFLELFRSWPLATAKSMYLTYCKPEVSCNSLVVMNLGKRSASLMKEFCNFCNLVMTLLKTVTVEITSYSNTGLIHCL